MRFGDEVVVISLHPEAEESVERLNGVRVYRLPIDNIYWPLDQKKRKAAPVRILWHLRDLWNRDAAARVGRILDKEKPDVVHTHVLAGFSVSVWKEIKERNIKLVHTMHDYYLLCMRSSIFRDGKVCENRCTGCKIGTLVRKASSKRLDAVVAVSDYVLQRHEQSGYFEKLPASVIYNVMDCMDATPRLRNSSSEVPLTFGYIGKIEEAKGIRVLLEATQRLSRANWHLRIAGTGLDAHVAGLKEEFSDPRIEWVGFADAKSFYASIDTSIIPSIWPDPLPYVAVESLNAGRSLICARSGGIPEIAALGSVVKTFPAADVFALAGIMDQALAESSIWLDGGFLNKDAKDLFSEDAIVAQYRAKYLGGGA